MVWVVKLNLFNRLQHDDPESGEVSALQAAVKAEKVEEVEELLLSGAEVNKRDKRGRTPLHYAVEQGKTETARVLLRNGADVGALFDGGTTALHLAARDGYREMVSLLLKYSNESAIESHADQGRSAMMWAVIGGNVEVVEELLDAKALPTEKCAFGLKTVDGLKGLRLSPYPLSLVLVHRCRYPAGDPEQGRSLLHTAVSRGNKGIVEALLQAGASAEVQDAQGKKPLDYTDDPALPNRDVIRMILLSYASNRVVAAGGAVETLSQVVNLTSGTVLGYLNLLTDFFVALNFLSEGDTNWYTLSFACISLPGIVHGILQGVRGFKESAIRSVFFMELGHSTLESVKTGTKTPNYMAMKVLELALESIPMSIIQLYVLIKDYTEWDQPSLQTEKNRPKILLFLSICFSFLSVMQTAAMMTLENEDSAWKGLLEGSTGMVIALFYYVGDVWTHIGIFAVFAYTHNEYLPVALSAMLFTMFVLLRLALGSSVMGIGRAILLSPLMMFVDFPLKPDKTTGLHNDWMWQRTLPISTAMFLVLATVMYVVPVQELPNYDHSNI
eukprot:gene10253-12127_t